MDSPSTTAKIPVRGVYVLAPTGPEFGTIVRVSQGTCLVKLPERAELEVGRATRLRFTTADPHRTPSVEALVTTRIEEPFARLYGFHMKLERAFLDSLTPELRKLFERRSERRMRITGNVRATVGLPRSAQSVTGQLHDVSARGAGILLPLGVDSYFVNATTVQVSFQLSEGAPFVFMASIRRRKLVQKEILYGLEYDVKNTPRGSSLAERLAKLLER